MLNNNSTNDSQVVKLSEIFLTVRCEKFALPATGKIFTSDNFANDWNSIYVNPSQLSEGEVNKNMRKITEPTLVITSHNSLMSFVMASKESPVFIPSNFNKTKENGFILAFRLAPIIMPEYIYYMCLYDVWKKLTARVTSEAVYEDEGWKGVGQIIECDDYVVTPEDILRGNFRQIELPSLARQKEFVAAGKQQSESYQAETKASTEAISNIAFRYLNYSRNVLDFGNASIGLLKEVYRRTAGEHVNKKVLEVLSQDDFTYREGVLSEEDLHTLESNLAETFSVLFNSSDYFPKNAREFIQPKEVTDFIVKILNLPEGITVYNPFSGLSSYGVALYRNKIVGEELNPITWAIGQIRIFAMGIDAEISLGDSFETLTSGKKYKAIVTSPAYLKEKDHQIHDIVEKLYDALDNDGLLACLVPRSFLFGKSSAVQTLREKLIKEKSLSGIITLPLNIFPGTSISQAVLVLSKGKDNDRVILGDASDYTRFSKSSYRMTTFEGEQYLKDLEDEIEDYYERGEYIDNSTIAAPILYTQLNSDNLDPAFYLVQRPDKGVSLSELFEQPVYADANVDDCHMYYITASSIPESMHRMPFVPNSVEGGSIVTAKSKIHLPEESVILAITPNGLRTVYTKNLQGILAYPSNVVRVLKPKAGISAQYLAAVLSTQIVSNQIKAQTLGNVLPNFNRINWNEILVPENNSKAEQERLIKDVISAEMSESEKQTLIDNDRRERELRSTRHAISQTVSALSSFWEQLKMFVEIKNGSLNTSDIIDNVNPMSVEELMGSISYAITTLGKQVDSIRLDLRDWGPEQPINPYKFINDYIRKHSTPSVKMINIGADNVADYPWYDEETGKSGVEHTEDDLIFYAPLSILEQIFDNIVDNAKEYGFTDKTRKDYEICFDWKTEDGNIIITIANNGQPLKEGVTGEDVLMSGFTTSLNETSSDGRIHSGTGGYEVKLLMEGIGNVEVLSDPDSKYPVVYKLTFEKTNYETIDLEN